MRETNPLARNEATAMFRKEFRGGTAAYFPVNDAAGTLCKLAGKEALRHDQLQLVRALGFRVEALDAAGAA